MFLLLLSTLVLMLSANNAENTFDTLWQYKCNAGHCEKTEIGPTDTAPQSLAVCQLLCDSSGNLWPMPTGHVSLENYTVHLNDLDIMVSGIQLGTNAGKLLRTNVDRLQINLLSLKAKSGSVNLVIHFQIKDDNPNTNKLTLNTNEKYTLNIHQEDNNTLNATISAENYFGARHGLETLSQLIVHDDLNSQIIIVRNAHIEDGPVYPYRGIMLDTSRNFIDKKTILKTIVGMGMSKLNTFHWHITDTHSFPYVSKTWPKLSKYGAYNPRKVYTSEDIKEIMEFGLLHGVRILPEMDAPAHVGEGWQWVGNDSTVCFKANSWRDFCDAPPCGQLNPTSDRVYEILEGIYSDMINDFKPDIFHMGGDQVNIGCWKSVKIIGDWMVKKGWSLTNADYIKLWSYFQTKAYNTLTKVNNGTEMNAILWTSDLTSKRNLKYLDPEKYIIQVYTKLDDPTVKRLLENKFKIIFSNYDALYLDCGYGAWIGEGNNWCSPYNSWQKIYKNSPKSAVKNLKIRNFKSNQVLGAEVALWSEQVGGAAIDTKLWPRAAAMAETTWAEPDISWKQAENRFLWHRERLTKNGVFSDAQQPEWCIQNQGAC